MRRLSLAPLALIAAATLHAQAPTAPTRGVTVDVAAAFDQHYRVSLEAAVIGPVSLGLTGSYTTHPDLGVGYPQYCDPGPCWPPVDCGNPNSLCTQPAIPCYGPGCGPDTYRAWSFDLNVRWYPRALSLRTPGAQIQPYVGEFIGYHSRRTSDPYYYYGCPACALPEGGAGPAGAPRDPVIIVRPQDSLLPPIDPLVNAAPTTSRVIEGFEPGIEMGVRVVPLPHVRVDVGWMLRLVRLDDPQMRKRPGDVDGRLVVAAGIGW